jgi:hypothetical protein
MWGPRKVLGSPKQRGVPEPQSTKVKKKNVETKPQTKNPKLPEILLLWIKYILEMSFLKKFLCIQKFLEKL